MKWLILATSAVVYWWLLSDVPVFTRDLAWSVCAAGVLVWAVMTERGRR